MPETSKKKPALGFPPPLLGEVPLRLGILAETADWLALDKPATVGTRAHPWCEGADLDGALNVQLEARKPELVRTGASLFGSVYALEPEISGVTLFAKNREALAALRNCFGSGECQFTFILLSASNQEAPAHFQADAPLLPHRIKPKMIPSSAKGKKSLTTFTRLADTDQGWTLWEAQTDFFRMHQIRAHAAVHGIPVLGDALYGGPTVPTVRELQPRARRTDLNATVFAGMAIHLSRLQFSSAAEATVIESAQPKHFKLLLKRLGLNPIQPTVAG